MTLFSVTVQKISSDPFFGQKISSDPFFGQKISSDPFFGPGLTASFDGNNGIVDYSGSGKTDSDGNAKWLITGLKEGTCTMKVKIFDALEIESNECVITVKP